MILYEGEVGIYEYLIHILCS